MLALVCAASIVRLKLAEVTGGQGMRYNTALNLEPI